MDRIMSLCVLQLIWLHFRKIILQNDKEAHIVDWYWPKYPSSGSGHQGIVQVRELSEIQPWEQQWQRKEKDRMQQSNKDKGKWPFRHSGGVGWGGQRPKNNKLQHKIKSKSWHWGDQWPKIKHRCWYHKGTLRKLLSGFCLLRKNPLKNSYFWSKNAYFSPFWPILWGKFSAIFR